MREHNLKTWPAQFTEIVRGEKTFEFRRNDRDFELLDILVLREFVPLEGGCYTGNSIRARVVTISKPEDGFGIPDGFCCMSIVVSPRSYISYEPDPPNT